MDATHTEPVATVTGSPSGWMCIGCGQTWPPDGRPDRCPKCSGGSFEALGGEDGRPVNGGLCLVPGCGRVAVERHLCHDHGSDLAVAGVDEPCRVPGCQTIAHVRGLCGTHYSAWLERRRPELGQYLLEAKPRGYRRRRDTRPGRPAAQPPGPSGPGSRPEGVTVTTETMGCNVPGCDRPAKGRGLCGMHLQRVTKGKPGPEQDKARRYMLPPRTIRAVDRSAKAVAPPAAPPPQPTPAAATLGDERLGQALTRARRLIELAEQRAAIDAEIFVLLGQ